MDTVVQSNAANAEESASAAEELFAQAEQMKGVVGGLVTLVSGNNDHSHASPRTRLSLPGTRPRSGLAPTPPRAALAAGPGSHPDQAFSPRPSNGKSRPLSPEEVIPLETDGFKDF
jgi:methyl-accepting chemotaxis protein